MDLRQLRYFVHIVDEGSFTAAAHRLNVAQPALSLQIRNLEQELGIKLLTRSIQGVAPTPAGARLYEHARAIQRQVELARDQVREYVGTPTGPVTIGLPASVALVLTVPLVEAVRRDLPKVSLRIAEGFSGSVLEWLKDGRLDFGCLYDTPPSRGLDSRPLVRERLYLIGPPGSGEADISLEELSALPLILPSRVHKLREMLEDAAKDSGVALNVNVELDGLPHIKALVARGTGFSVLALSAVLEEWRGKAVAARLVTRPHLSRTVHLCRAKGTPLTDAAAAVRDTLVRLARGLVAGGAWPGDDLSTAR